MQQTTCASIKLYINENSQGDVSSAAALPVLSFSIPAFYEAVKDTAILPEIKAAFSDDMEDFVRELGKTKNQLRRQVYYILPGQGEETHIPKQEGISYI